MCKKSCKNCTYSDEASKNDYSEDIYCEERDEYFSQDEAERVAKKCNTFKPE